jgi:hypothetical protein
VVKSGNSCEDMLAVGGLKLEREAELGVRFSGKGKTEGGRWLEGRGWLLVKGEMVTDGVRGLRARGR